MRERARWSLGHRPADLVRRPEAQQSERVFGPVKLDPDVFQAVLDARADQLGPDHATAVPEIRAVRAASAHTVEVVALPSPTNPMISTSFGTPVGEKGARLNRDDDVPELRPLLPEGKRTPLVRAVDELRVLHGPYMTRVALPMRRTERVSRTLTG